MILICLLTRLNVAFYATSESLLTFVLFHPWVRFLSHVWIGLCSLVTGFEIHSYARRGNWGVIVSSEGWVHLRIRPKNAKDLFSKDHRRNPFNKRLNCSCFQEKLSASSQRTTLLRGVLALGMLSITSFNCSWERLHVTPPLPPWPLAPQDLWPLHPPPPSDPTTGLFLTHQHQKHFPICHI